MEYHGNQYSLRPHDPIVHTVLHLLLVLYLHPQYVHPKEFTLDCTRTPTLMFLTFMTYSLVLGALRYAEGWR